MNDNGINGDLAAGDSVYTARINAFGTTGIKVFTITANDTLNNTRTITANVQIDNLGPAINNVVIYYPNPGSEAGNGNTITISANITEGIKATVDCSAVGAGIKQMATADGVNYSAQCTLIYSETANQNIVINATDENGNTAQLSWPIGIDNAPPAIVENVSLYDIAPAVGTVLLQWPAANDAAYYKIYRSSTPDFDVAPGFYIKNTTSPGVYDTPGAEGIYYYKVSAVDNIGNEDRK